MGRNQLHCQLLHMWNRICQCSFYQTVQQRRLTQCLFLQRLHSLLSWRRSLFGLPGMRLRVHRGDQFWRHNVNCAHRHRVNSKVRHAEPNNTWRRHAMRRICVCILHHPHMSSLPPTRCVSWPKCGLHPHTHCSCGVTVVPEKTESSQRRQCSRLWCWWTYLLTCHQPNDSQY